MDIRVRRLSKKYLEVTIVHWGSTIELGLHSKDECKDLALVFEEAVDDLTSGWPEESLTGDSHE